MISKEQRLSFLETLDKELDHLILKREIKDQPRLKEEILVYVDMGILRPLLEDETTTSKE